MLTLLEVWTALRQPRPRNKEKETYLKKRSIKSGAMTIKDGITHMYIADYNDANASERVVGSKFGDYARTYYPGYAQLSFHIMDWRGKQKNWILLDNQSTVHLFRNPALLCSMSTEAKPVDVHSSGVTEQCDTEGNLPNFE